MVAVADKARFAVASKVKSPDNEPLATTVAAGQPNRTSSSPAVIKPDTGAVHQLRNKHHVDSVQIGAPPVLDRSG